MLLSLLIHLFLMVQDEISPIIMANESQQRNVDTLNKDSFYGNRTTLCNRYKRFNNKTGMDNSINQQGIPKLGTVIDGKCSDKVLFKTGTVYDVSTRGYLSSI